MDATLPDISVALSSFSYSPISGPGHLYKNRVTDEDGMGGGLASGESSTGQLLGSW